MFFSFSIVTVLARYPVLSGTGNFESLVGVLLASCTCCTQEGPHLSGESAWSTGTTQCWCQTWRHLLTEHGGVCCRHYCLCLTEVMSHRYWYLSMTCFFFFYASVKTHLCCVYIQLQSYIGQTLKLLCWWKRFCRQLYNQLNSVPAESVAFPKSNCGLGKVQALFTVKKPKAHCVCSALWNLKALAKARQSKFICTAPFNNKAIQST